MKKAKKSVLSAIHVEEMIGGNEMSEKIINETQCEVSMKKAEMGMKLA